MFRLSSNIFIGKNCKISKANPSPLLPQRSFFQSKALQQEKLSVFDDSMAFASILAQRTTQQSVIPFEKIVQGLTAKEILENQQDRKLVTIPENKTVFEALKKMNQEDVGCIIVEKLSGHGFGIFTETDYVRKIALRGLSSKTTELIQVMNNNVTTVHRNTNIEQMSSLMMQDGIHHLPVVEVTGEPKNQKLTPLGVISARDVAKSLIKAVESASDVTIEGNVRDVFNKMGRRSSPDIWMRDDDSVFSAIEKMAKNEISAVLVNSATKMSGIFTERDYLNRIILKGRSSRNTTLKEAMTSKVHFVNAETSTRDCLHLASKKRIRHIPIVSLLGNEINIDQLVGLVTVNDIISFLMLQLEQKKLKKVSPDIDL